VETVETEPSFGIKRVLTVVHDLPTTSFYDAMSEVNASVMVAQIIWRFLIFLLHFVGSQVQGPCYRRTHAAIGILWPVCPLDLLKVEGNIFYGTILTAAG
jgi:hypothetical protein